MNNLQTIDIKTKDAEASKPYQRTIEAPVSKAEALYKIARVSEWWGSDMTGTARRVGDTFTIRFGDTSVDFKVTEACDDKVLWLVTNSYLPWLTDKTEWTGTSILWELSSERGTTTVAMTHQGLVPEVECYEGCEKGWDFYIGTSLRQFLTDGTGHPDQRPRA